MIKKINFLLNNLSKNKVWIFGTETIYGIGANAYDSTMCAKIFSIKNRPQDNPLIVHVGSIAQLNEFAELSDLDKLLINKFWPGPLTLILNLKSSSKIASNILVNNNKVAVRMPAKSLHLMKDHPIAAPSANISGYISPSLYDHALELYVRNYKEIEMVPSKKILSKNLESTIFDSTTRQILRHGPISLQEIQKIIPEAQNVATATYVTPGAKYKHYSPNVQVISDISQKKGIVLVIGKKNSKFKGIKKYFVKNNLYANLHIAEAYAKKNNTYINIEYDLKLPQALLEKLKKILNKI